MQTQTQPIYERSSDELSFSIHTVVHEEDHSKFFELLKASFLIRQQTSLASTIDTVLNTMLQTYLSQEIPSMFIDFEMNFVNGEGYRQWLLTMLPPDEESVVLPSADYGSFLVNKWDASVIIAFMIDNINLNIASSRGLAPKDFDAMNHRRYSLAHSVYAIPNGIKIVD